MKSKSLLQILIITTSFLIVSLQSANAGRLNTGIIVALDETFEQLKSKISISDNVVIGGRTFLQGWMDETPVTIVRSPMGKVNNAITAQMLISSFNVERILSISPAGALVDSVNIGDVLIAAEVYQHDFGTLKPYGFIWSRAPVNNPDASVNYNNFAINKFASSMPKIEGLNKLLQGNIVSGDQFIASVEKRSWLNQKFQAMAVEMGAAAIVQTCYSNNIPVIIIRVITDYAGVNARITFSRSMPSYQTDINLTELLLHLCAYNSNSR